MHFSIKKTRVFLLSILILDKSKISYVIEILQEYFKFLNLTDNIINEIIIIVKEN